MKPQRSRIHDYLARSRDGSFKCPNTKKTGRDISIIDRCYFVRGLIEDRCLYSLSWSHIRMLFCCDVPPSSATDMPFPAFAQSYCGSYNTPSAKEFIIISSELWEFSLPLLYLTQQTILIHQIILIFGFLNLTSILPLAVVVETSLPGLLMMACPFCYWIWY